jgi:hypothetical protein
MANEFIDNRWILDTAAATMHTTDPVYIKRIRWVGTGLTAGTSAVIIQDDASKTIWSSLATGTTVVESDLIERWWHTGFKVPTLAGGTVFIELGEAP